MQINSFVRFIPGYGIVIGQVKEIGNKTVTYVDEMNQLFVANIEHVEPAERPDYWNAQLDSIEIIG